jgi:hypothetical protein
MHIIPTPPTVLLSLRCFSSPRVPLLFLPCCAPHALAHSISSFHPPRTSQVCSTGCRGKDACQLGHVAVICFATLLLLGFSRLCSFTKVASPSYCVLFTTYLYPHCRLEKYSLRTLSASILTTQVDWMVSPRGHDVFCPNRHLSSATSGPIYYKQGQPGPSTDRRSGSRSLGWDLGALPARPSLAKVANNAPGPLMWKNLHFYAAIAEWMSSPNIRHRIDTAQCNEETVHELTVSIRLRSSDIWAKRLGSLYRVQGLSISLNRVSFEPSYSLVALVRRSGDRLTLCHIDDEHVLPSNVPQITDTS